MDNATPVFCVGLSHHSAPVELLEALSRRAEELPGVLPSRPAEVVVLSTCNRFEIFGSLSAGVLESTMAFFQRAGVLDSVHQLVGRDAAHRLYRIVSGLDSMVLGESQIIGQVAAAYAAAQSARRAGPVMTALFQGAIRAGRRARRETEIGKSASSISAAAVRLAEESLGGFTNARVLVLGAGEMGRLTLRSLRERGVANVDVASRQLDKAARAARRFGAKAHLITSVPCLLESTDAVISATSASRPPLTADMLRTAMHERHGRPLVVVDIAVPRDVEPEAAALPGVRLFDLDALKGRDDNGESVRLREVPRVERIIEEELDALSIAMAENSLRPVIGSLWQKASSIRQEVLDHTRARIPQLDDASWTHVENLARALVNKLLHEPATRLRAEAANGHASDYAEALRFLFDLPTPTRQGRQS
ncbi:MAG TPA: glutamyl-tRNA reductase [Spirochaetia bacterium]|nr:glutamyl-tRNA reductase [Spirochaetia bacterium]